MIRVRSRSAVVTCTHMFLLEAPPLVFSPFALRVNLAQHVISYSLAVSFFCFAGVAKRTQILRHTWAQRAECPRYLSSDKATHPPLRHSFTEPPPPSLFRATPRVLFHKQPQNSAGMPASPAEGDQLTARITGRQPTQDSLRRRGDGGALGGGGGGGGGRDDAGGIQMGPMGRSLGAESALV